MSGADETYGSSAQVDYLTSQRCNWLKDGGVGAVEYSNCTNAEDSYAGGPASDSLYRIARAPTGRVSHELRYARALVDALTFQLAADMIESSITTSWESVGRLAAIAVIRTFLNNFLERDLAELRERVHEQQV